jgi:hypothetical protein
MLLVEMIELGPLDGVLSKAMRYDGEDGDHD